MKNNLEKVFFSLNDKKGYYLIEDKDGTFDFYFLENMIETSKLWRKSKKTRYKSLWKFFENEEDACNFVYTFFNNNEFKDERWTFYKTADDFEELKLKGVNIWDFEWSPTDQFLHVKHPIYEQRYLADKYEVIANDIKISFAAIEFSNCVWGFFVMTCDNVFRI